MAGKKQLTRPSELSRKAREILLFVHDEFVSGGRPTAALIKGYEGPRTKDLEVAFCADGGNSKVDFELAVAELEDGQLIGSGPWVPYDNKPGSPALNDGSVESWRQCLRFGMEVFTIAGIDHDFEAHPERLTESCLSG
jgi:hypothetical protein